MTRRQPEDLRSARWYAAPTRMGSVHRQRAAQAGHPRQDYEGKPVIGIFSTWSDLNPCHGHFRERAQNVKEGVWQAGGFPVEVPVMSLGEPYIKPSALLYRNMLAMEVEEMLRAHPIDGVVLMGGCDKTTPAMLMGAMSMDLPAIFVPSGPMLSGRWRGKPLGSGTDTSKLFMEYKAGQLSHADFVESELASSRSPGHCMTMGTAATMTSLAEVLGMTLPGAAAIPAPDSRHAQMASLTGRRIVDMVWEDLRPSAILTRKAFDNALAVLMALGGSTNAMIHLIAMARRAGIPLTLSDFEPVADRVPVLVNLKPSGEYLMEDFFEAGGVRGLLSMMRDLLDLSAPTVSGMTLGEAIDGAQVYHPDVIRPMDRPLKDKGGLVILRGNLAPDGCVIKRSAADPARLKHRGRALVFQNYDDMTARIDDPALDVDADSVLVLRSAGPRGVPGMPEWGMLPIPQKLLQQGVRDMLRISDARMSGTHFGTVVLHVTPESAVGGPLALVEDGDFIELDVDAKRIHLDVSDEELARRRAAWVMPDPPIQRGWGRLFHDHVSQANEGCDFPFLLPGAPTREPQL
ncbi:L-arabinonate dehydratase [Hydrogenophaga sp.]|uniref:L-arabinonate dehydratase n=1 Tax=Hydrogenophaga sp. TaxID=1904254 RepID=UPI0027228F13|nr:L-arabinonate dehydratase [Hydrogenophaga sp.]MDO9437160.1 L-arabinonate dehydratase [Hydrogenophaga sp.]